MKKKMILVVLAFLLILQAQTVFAESYDQRFCRELNENDIDDIESLLEKRAKQMDLPFCMLKTLMAPQAYDKNSIYNTQKFKKENCLEVLKLLVRFGADVNRPMIFDDGSSSGYPLQRAIGNKQPISVIQFLLDSGANPNLSSAGTFSPVELAYRNNDMPVLNLLLDRGANGATLLPELVSKGDNDFIKRLIAKGVQIRSNEGAEALRSAAELGKFDSVKLLVENGVNVNARDSKGNTALAFAYDKGEMEIYNYLKAHGAVDFEPKQVAQQPAAPAPAPSTTNVYVQPSAPAPAQSAPAQPSRNIGKEIAEAFRSPLQSGTYSLVGSQEKISLAAIAKSGIISQTSQGKTYQGTYNIDGNRMTVQIRGYTFVFNITSETSFSGHGETWVRTGY